MLKKSLEIYVSFLSDGNFFLSSKLRNFFLQFFEGQTVVEGEKPTTMKAVRPVSQFL